jgi:hypothetical protein
MVAAFQAVTLDQFLERLVFDPLAPGSGLISHLRGISVQFTYSLGSSDFRVGFRLAGEELFDQPV